MITKRKIKQKIKERDAFIEDFISELEERISSFQQHIYAAIMSALYSVDIEDYQEAFAAVDKTIAEDKEFIAFLAWYRKKVRELSSISSNYFSLFDIERDVSLELPVREYMSKFTQAKRGFPNEIKVLLASFIFAGMTVNEVETASRNIILGDKKKGLAMRKLFVDMRDAAMSSLRATDVRYAKSGGLEYAYYEGGILGTSRCFCQQRYSRFWSLATIDSWNDLDWSGRMEGVDVKVALGGWNCIHQLMWVDEETAIKYGYDEGYGSCS